MLTYSDLGGISLTSKALHSQLLNLDSYVFHPQLEQYFFVFGLGQWASDEKCLYGKETGKGEPERKKKEKALPFIKMKRYQGDKIETPIRTDLMPNIFGKVFQTCIFNLWIHEDIR